MLFRLFSLVLFLDLLAVAAVAQRFAVFEPQNPAAVPGMAELVRAELSKKIRILEPEMAEAAFRSVEIADHFNMSAEEAKRIGSVVGCDRFVLIKTRIQRRAAAEKPEHFEAYAVVYIVDSRTGLLIDWLLNSQEGRTIGIAETSLKADASSLADSIAAKIISTGPAAAALNFPEPPPERSPQAKEIKLPVPYKRIKPEYTSTAFFYGIKATVDIEADIDVDGSIKGTRIVRWAGYGLDQSVERAVRAMNWRPAMLDGKPLPMRVLLRYNFTKIERDEEP